MQELDSQEYLGLKPLTFTFRISFLILEKNGKVYNFHKWTFFYF